MFLNHSLKQLRSYHQIGINHCAQKAIDYAPSRQQILEATLDLRSDTVTKPCEKMLNAMMKAPVADDIYDGDPTVVQLERQVAQLCGFESSMFCASTTMSNQIASCLHTQRLQSVLCDARAHIYQSEAGAIGFHSQAQCIPVELDQLALKTGNTYPHAHLNQELVQQYFIPDDGDVHTAPTKLIVIENTLHGQIIPQISIEQIRDFVDEQQTPHQQPIRMHCDGTRLWNVSIFSKHSLLTLCKPFDTVALCLSKGLGCPVGSMLVGCEETIRRAKHLRKAFGGGWRQAGILAAAAIYAIEQHWPLMENDHANARLLADGLTEQLGFKLSIDHHFPEQKPHTNIVWIDTTDLGLCAYSFQKKMAEHGILIAAQNETIIRLVTHLQTPTEKIEKFLDLTKEFLHQNVIESL